MEEQIKKIQVVITNKLYEWLPAYTESIKWLAEKFWVDKSSAECMEIFLDYHSMFFFEDFYEKYNKKFWHLPDLF